MNEKILKIENLSIGYKARKKITLVAENLNTAMRKNELTCLLGSNGSGKSTLLKTLCAFQDPLEGSININGRALDNLNEKDISNLISVVLTDRIVVPNASVEELVGYGRSPHTGLMGKLTSKDKLIVEEAMLKSGIIHKRHNNVSELSDGERQKAFIAKAIAQDTPIILLDEPTAFLDLPAKVEIMQLLREIANKTDKSILMSTHDLDLALQLSDKLWLLQDGGKLTTGSPEDLLLTNAFQNMFQRKGVKFDNSTGLFVVQHIEKTKIQLIGDGFKKILLSRALARKGIKTQECTDKNIIWINIEEKSKNEFQLMQKDDCIFESKSIEQFINHIINNKILKLE